MKTFTAFLALLAVSCCSSRQIERRGAIPSQFTFVTSGTTLQQVVDTVGPWTRIRGSGVQWYQFDQPDGSAVLVLPDWPFTRTNKIHTIWFVQHTNEIDIHP